MKKYFLIIIISLCILTGCENFNRNYYCNGMGVLDDDNMCTEIIRKEPDKEYYCYDSIYNDVLNEITLMCEYTVSSPAIINYTCPAGYTKYNSFMCQRRDNIISATLTYYCSYGNLKGSNCVAHYSYPALVNYTCDYGYDLVNNICMKMEVYPALWD